MTDSYFIDLALQLAAKGAGQVSPNPMVGALVVRDGEVVGRGYHLYNRVIHAEVLALEAAGYRARGATLYVNLEPCSHQGNGKRTGPCVNAVITAQVKRVVSCAIDPNPKVSGNGFARLRESGIEVSVGLGADAERKLNKEYIQFITASPGVAHEQAKRSQLREPLSIEHVASARLPTEWGEFKIAGYRSRTSDEEFVALYTGDIQAANVPLVRIHSQCITGEAFGSVKCDCGAQLRRTLEAIAREGTGIVVYQLQEGRGIGIVNKIRAYALQDNGADTVEANERLGLGIDLREYKQCAEILVDLGQERVRLLSNNPLKLIALKEAGIEVVERVAIEIEPNDNDLTYLRTKKHKMGHILTSV